MGAGCGAVGRKRGKGAVAEGRGAGAGAGRTEGIRAWPMSVPMCAREGGGHPHTSTWLARPAIPPCRGPVFEHRVVH